jgi:hypothetical protein
LPFIGADALDGLLAQGGVLRRRQEMRYPTPGISSGCRASSLRAGRSIGGGLGLRAQELAASKTHNPARTRSVTRAFASAGETTRMNLLGSGRWDSHPLGTRLAGGRSLLCPSCCLDLCVLCLSEF